MTQIKSSRDKSRKEPLTEPFSGNEAKESNPLAKKETKPKKARKPRVPLGGAVKKLDVQDLDPNYKYRIFNDVGGRLERAEAAWWEPVLDETGSVDRRVVGKNSNGQPIYGQVMRIEKSLFEEDKRAKQAKIDELEEGLRRGHVQGGISQNAYIPSSGIKIERS